MRPFRILIIEDDIRCVKPALEGKAYPSGSEYYFLQMLFKEWMTQADASKVPLEVYWSQTVDFTQKHLVEQPESDPPLASENEEDSVYQIFPRAEKNSEGAALVVDTPECWATLRCDIDVAAFLGGIDVLVLDLRGLTGKLPEANAERIAAELKRITGTAPVNLQELLVDAKLSFQGVYFFHAHHQSLMGCQLVVILSAHDEDNAIEQKPIRALLHPFCGVDTYAPYTVKYGKDKVTAMGRKASLHSRILCLFQDYCEGYTQLRHLGSIEQAAHHDLPVLIVGESGTGKEYVARAIHRRWLAEKRRLEESTADTFVVVNCAGLTSELARSELFGHVAGSFTGATDHRLGAILKACGLRGFKKTPDSYRKKATEAAKKAKDLTDAVAGLAKLTKEKRLEHFGSHVLPGLNAVMADDENALIALLNAVRGKMENAAYGHDLVQDYYTGLLDRNAEHAEALTVGAEKEYLGVRFRHPGPIGTLFLDEFGDLPPEVQNLLLRFLEEKSGEIQPLGYSGRIMGLKIRLILATSDPRVAKFAGYDLLGKNGPSDRNLDRSFRNDLLFRVKGQVIKTEAITTQAQLMETLDEMIARHFPDSWQWDDDAKEYLAGPQGKITGILDALSGRASNRSAPNMIFGQRRELKRIIDLVAHYMNSAEARGLRLESRNVTRRIVEEVWRPSELLMTKPIERNADAAETRGQPPAAVFEAVQQALVAFFNSVSLEFTPSAKDPSEWAKLLSDENRKKFLALADSLTKVNKKNFKRDENRSFEILMQRPGGSLNSKAIRTPFQPSRSNERKKRSG